MELKELREQIDEIDNEVLALILKRRKIIDKVAVYKKSHQMPVFAPEREKEVLQRLTSKVPHNEVGGIRLIYQMLMDLTKLREYESCPKCFVIPTGLGGASVRAILDDAPGSLCRYLSPLAAAGVSVTDIHSKAMPGGKLVVDLELIGDINENSFASALSVISDTAEKFTLL